MVDGSAVTANIGVNLCLTITAQAERAMTMWPDRGDADPRPAINEPYAPMPPVLPAFTVLPDGTPAAIRYDGSGGRRDP